VKTPLLDYKWGPSFEDTTDVPAGAIIVKNNVLIEHLNKSNNFYEFANNLYLIYEYLLEVLRINSNIRTNNYEGARL
jgi:hypothetical protein